MAFSWWTWLVSVAAVLISALLAWREGNFTRRAGLDMGFVNHGGMWGDLLLLPIANAVIVPHVRSGAWIPVALLLSAVLSIALHIHWYHGDAGHTNAREHLWPWRPQRSWWRDLSLAGWAHVLYVIGELTVLLGLLLFPMPREAVALVAVILVMQVPLGTLQPRWFLKR